MQENGQSVFFFLNQSLYNNELVPNKGKSERLAGEIYEKGLICVNILINIKISMTIVLKISMPV